MSTVSTVYFTVSMSTVFITVRMIVSTVFITVSVSTVSTVCITASVSMSTLSTWGEGVTVRPRPEHAWNGKKLSVYTLHSYSNTNLDDQLR